MYTTERKSTENRNTITSKYLTSSKKKFYLASNDESIEQLKEKQIKDLTQILIKLKSEYDNIIKESNEVREESEGIIKKTKILEQMDKKMKLKKNEVEENNSNILAMIEMKKHKKEEESYSNETLSHTLEKLREEVVTTRKDISVYNLVNEKLIKEYEKQKIEENNIKQKIDHVYSQIHYQRMKNNYNKNEYDLQLQYYNSILNQRWNFIKSSDERKEQQKKIAEIAKNSTQDEQEVKCRKTLFFCYLYNKYLHKAMEKELKESERIEETFQLIRDITGGTNLKLMVDKILKHDRNYNTAVTTVSEKETIKEVIQNDIKELELVYKELNNKTIDKSDTIILPHMEEDDYELVKKEQELFHDLKVMQQKHSEIKLIYENTIENIKVLCKHDKREETNISVSIDNKSHDTTLLLLDEDVIRMYNEFLDNLRKKVEKIVETNDHDKFKEIMKDKGYEPVNTKQRSKVRSNKQSEYEEKLLQNLRNQKSEYEKNDDMLNNEDQRINNARQKLIEEYRRKEEERVKAIEKEKQANKK